MLKSPPHMLTAAGSVKAALPRDFSSTVSQLDCASTGAASLGPKLRATTWEKRGTSISNDESKNYPTTGAHRA
jgi:hypothetical protein